jgi:hypothetical protein
MSFTAERCAQPGSYSFRAVSAAAHGASAVRAAVALAQHVERLATTSNVELNQPLQRRIARRTRPAPLPSSVLMNLFTFKRWRSNSAVVSDAFASPLRARYSAPHRER